MQRQVNRSLRHVGRLNEGYLSDVHTSFSNIQYDSDASSDLVESSRAIEKQFKDKYRVLRGAYERRIEQLTASVESVCARLMGDDLIASMKTDAASSVFIPAHISETLASYLKGERENDIQDLLERESSLNIQLKRKNAIIDNQNHRLAELEDVSTKGKASEGEVGAMQEKIKALETQYSAYSLQMKEEVDNLRRSNEAEINMKKSLQEQLNKNEAILSAKQIELERAKADNGIKMREVYELEKSIQLADKDMTHLSETESRQKIELDQCTQKLKRALDQRDSMAADIQRLTEKLRYSSEDLEKAQQAHELLLREKNKYQQNMDEAIAKSKRLLTDEIEQSREEVNLSKKKMKNMIEKFELDLDREKHATQTYKDEAAISKAIIEEKQKEIRTLSNDAVAAREAIDALHDKLTNVREILEDTNVQLLRTKNTSKEWQSRAHEAENRINEILHSHKKEKQAIAEQIQMDVEKQMELERKQLESKSDVFRMHYQNQLLDLDISRTNMSLSRSMSIAPRIDMKHSGVFDEERRSHQHQQSFQEPPRHRISHNTQEFHYEKQMQQLQSDYDELKEQYEIQRQESSNLQLKIQRLNHLQTMKPPNVPEHQFENQLQQLQNDYKDLQEQYKRKQQELIDLQSSQSRHYKPVDSQLQQIEIDYVNLQEQYKRQQQELTDLRSRHKQPDNSQLQQLHQDYEELRLKFDEQREGNMQRVQTHEDFQEKFELQLEESNSLQIKLQQAADTIEILKEMVTRANSNTDNLNEENKRKQGFIEKLEHECEVLRKEYHSQPTVTSPPAVTSPSDTDIETQGVGISRVRKLEAEIVRLQGALSQAQSQAREDHEQDSILLQSMQQKFETLVSNFESCRNEQNESLVEQEGIVTGLEDKIASLTEVNSLHENTITELQTQIKEMVDFNRHAENKHEDEVNALRNECAGHQDALDATQEIIKQLNDELQQTKIELNKYLIASEESGDVIREREGEANLLKKKNQSLRDTLAKMDTLYRIQIRDLRTALGRVQDSVVVLERSIESEVEVMNHKTEAFTRPIFDRLAKNFDEKLEVEMKRLASAHMKEEKHLIGTLKKKLKENTDENDNSSVNSNRSHESTQSSSELSCVVGHYKVILKSIFDALSTSSIIENSSAKDIMFYLESANVRNISDEQVGEKNANTIGVVSAKLYEILTRELNKYVRGKEQVAAQVELMSDMLRKEKINTAELKMSFQKKIRSKSIDNNQSVNSMSDSESDRQIKKLERYIEELKHLHKGEIDRLTIEWESETSAKLDSLNSQIQEGEELRQELENKLRTEQTRRHHLQSRLVSEEAEHRSEMEDFEMRFFDLQRRFAQSQGETAATNYN